MPPRKRASNGARNSEASDKMLDFSAPPLTQSKLSSLKKRISAPPDRVYESSTPLTQTKWPVPRKHIRSYGKKTTVRIPKPTKQETLTQMDYVRMSDPAPMGDEEEDGDPDEIEEPDEDYEKQAKKRRNKRRKTTGDEPDSTPSFHTQRLTQMEWSFSSAPDDEEDPSIFEVPSSSQTNLPTLSSRRKAGESSKTNATEAEPSPNVEMPPPQTPRRILATEIPSSQSPATPFSLPSRGSLRRSPLKETSANTPIPFNTGRRPEASPDRLPKLEVKDTYDSADTSQFSRIPSSPAKNPSPAKSVRWADLPDDDDDEVKEPRSPSVKRRSTPARKSAMKRTEILDSDAESNEDLEEDPEEDEEMPLGREFEDEGLAVAGSPELGNDENYRISESADPTGSVDLGLDEDTEEQEGRKMSPEFGNDELVGQISAEQESQQEELDQETCYGDIGLETQMEADRILSTSARSSMTAPPSESVNDEDKEADEDQDIQHEMVVEKTQIMESQRLSTQHVHSMGPRTAESDVFMSFHAASITNILSRAKNHEFRNWAIAPHVCRIWIYETQPVSMLQYMAEIGPAKRPGELMDENGLGNIDFNSKASTWRAYEILQVYQLANPKTLAEVKENGWLKAPPSKFSRVAPAVIDELMANLLPPLFLDRCEPEPTATVSSSTDTQEVDEQIASTMAQFTQPADPSQALSEPNDEEEDEYEADEEEQEEKEKEEERIPSSSPSPQATPRPPPRLNRPPPSQATTVDLSQSQTPPRHSQREIIFESPAGPVTSTPALPTPRHGSDAKTQNHESHPPFSMSSSQILSKTQLLSDSLLHDSAPGPPPFIRDSDDEEDD